MTAIQTALDQLRGLSPAESNNLDAGIAALEAMQAIKALDSVDCNATRGKAMNGIIHISLSHKREGIPAIGEGCHCSDANCPGPDGWIASSGYAGGGRGPYKRCDLCGNIAEKDCEPDESDEPITKGKT
jgi:hypothetical protein